MAYTPACHGVPYPISPLLPTTKTKPSLFSQLIFLHILAFAVGIAIAFTLLLIFIFFIYIYKMKPIKNQPETSCACFVLSLVIKSSVDVCQHIIIYAHGEAHLTLGQALRGELFYLQSSELYLDDVNSVPLIEVNENIEKEILSFSFLSLCKFLKGEQTSQLLEEVAMSKRTFEGGHIPVTHALMEHNITYHVNFFYSFLDS